MFRLGADLKVYLHREPIDFRAGINSLAVLVQETMALDPFAPAVFAFCNRRRDRMKLLFFDRSGFVLVLKRLTEDKFRWPRREAAVVTLTISVIDRAAGLSQDEGPWQSTEPTASNSSDRFRRSISAARPYMLSRSATTSHAI
ncbi:IS66 family insertion sequence element accessory protein TnpB [Mesorhizobium sp. M1423]|uniref:IS66 family insertion sequence element accessory protein TnpB n=1 Tax=Mesorhizobium sp. M1423 TaxID=2957101 RepID=UPI00333561CA